MTPSAKAEGSNAPPKIANRPGLTGSASCTVSQALCAPNPASGGFLADFLADQGAFGSQQVPALWADCPTPAGTPLGGYRGARVLCIDKEGQREGLYIFGLYAAEGTKKVLVPSST